MDRLITKYVNFDYFYVICRPINNQLAKDTPFDLRSVLKILEDKNLTEKTISYKQEKARMESFSAMGHTQNLWDMYFSRLRDFNLPTRGFENAPSKPLDLEDDEYIGENVSAIYDDSSHIIMVQRNKFSLGPSAVEDYFNKFCNPNERIYLRPIMIQDVRKKLKQAEVVRKLRLKFADVKSAQDRANGPNLKKWLTSFEDYEAVSGEIILTVGRKRKGSLGGDLTGLIEEIYENEDVVTRAEASIKKTDLDSSELIDLFSNNAHSIAAFQLLPRATLNHEAVILKMEELYNERRAELISILGR